MNVSQSALDAEALFYEAGSFSEVEGLDYIAEAAAAAFESRAKGGAS